MYNTSLQPVVSCILPRPRPSWLDTVFTLGKLERDGSGEKDDSTSILQRYPSTPAMGFRQQRLNSYGATSGHATSAVTIYGNQQLPMTQGTVPGVMQIKVPISHGTDCDVPIVVQVGNASSQPVVTIAVGTCI
jgi:hypothetical protein